MESMEISLTISHVSSALNSTIYMGERKGEFITLIKSMFLDENLFPFGINCASHEN